MSLQEKSMEVSSGSGTRRIAMLVRSGGSPGLFWLGGFRSDMTGSKAEALDAYGARTGLAVTRFDYSGHGTSGGSFLDGTISRWLEEALAVFATTTGPQIVVGSSMGGWLALLLNQALRASGKSRVRGLVLIAPAVDMTEDLMRLTFSPAQLHDLHLKGRLELASDYSDEPDIITAGLIQDGARHILMGKGSIETSCPVVILQGGADSDVPPEHAMKLLSHLTLDPVTFTLVPDGDHRLSRDADLERLVRIVSRLVEAGEAG